MESRSKISPRSRRNLEASKLLPLLDGMNRSAPSVSTGVRFEESRNLPGDFEGVFAGVLNRPGDFEGVIAGVLNLPGDFDGVLAPVTVGHLGLLLTFRLVLARDTLRKFLFDEEGLFSDII